MRTPIAAALVVMAAASAMLAAQRQGIVIRTEVIPVPVTVLQGGRFVTNLKAQDFEIFDDGQPQELTSFALEESGIAAVLLLDVSQSMTSRIDEVKRAAAQFVRQLGPNDVVQIVQFDHMWTPLSEFTSDHARLEGAIKQAKIGGATALRNAVYRALAELKARKRDHLDDQRHRAIVLLTDGDDTASGISDDEVKMSARSVDALIYAISLEAQDGRPVTDSRSAIFLADLARQNGGVLLFPELSDLQKRYRELAEELRHQYVLGYLTPEGPARSKWHSILVRVKNHRDMTVRHRPGYFSSNAEGQ